MAEMSQAPEASSQAAPKDTRPLYEVGYHIVPTVDETQLGKEVEALRNEITKAGGEITLDQFPQKLVLSYTVERSVAGKREKYSESYFGFIQFVAEEREGIPALEKYLQTNKNILRFLLIHTVREEVQSRRAIFSSNRLEGETLKKPASTTEEPAGEVSDDEINKSIDAIVI